MSRVSDESRRGKGRALAFAAALALLAVARGRPCEAAPTSAAELEAARSAFAEGLALEAKERWAEALSRFDRAAAIRASPQVAFHRGLCLEHLGHLVDALDAFVRAERDAATEPTAKRVARLAAHHVATLRKRLPVVVLHTPENAGSFTVTLDGQPLSSAALGLPLPVDPGDHELVVEAPRREPGRQRFRVRESEKIEVGIAPGAELPASPEREEPPGGAAASLAAERGAPAPLPPPVPLAPAASEAPAPSRSVWVWPLVSGSVALASFATAGVMYGMRASALDDLQEGCAGREVCPEELRSLQDQGRAYTTAGNVALGVGLVATAAAAVTFVVLRPSSGTSMTVTAGAARFAVQGTF